MTREDKLDKLFDLMHELINQGNRTVRNGVLVQFFATVEGQISDGELNRLVKYMETQKGQL